MPEGETEIGKGGVGAYLRSVRESRGLQLDDASKVTKISKNYLSAIEEDDFAKLPNPAYIKGFLRLYASYLSLSGDDVVQRYEASVPPVVTPAIEHGAQHTGVQIVERAKLGGPGRWVVPALLLVLVILAAVFLSEQEKQPRPAAQVPQAETPAPAPAPAPAASATPEKAALQPQRSSAVQQPGTTPARTETTATAAPGAAKGSGVVLKLRFNRDTWLSITIDDAISQRYDLKAGDVIEWKGSRAFVLDLGDGSAVEAELNGKPLKTLGEPGKPAHVELKAP